MRKRVPYCGQVNESLIGQTVELFGWVHRRRDLGGVIFINLRDREGIVQVVCDPNNQEVFAAAEKIRNEYILHVKGVVRARPEGMRNKDMATGQVEIEAQTVDIVSAAQTPPFSLENYVPVSEEVRLRYRYLDLRRPEMAKKIKFRARLAQAIRHFLDNHGFLEIETPVLTRATPEGARDYLVPSRVHPNHFYALPQSPQLFKQLLMMSGMDRYYQIVRCFRDEDLRADRQPEFTQLDVEMSFVEEADIHDLMEAMFKELFKKLLNVDLPDFPRLTYAEAMNRYGSDKPDLRIPLEFVDVADVFKNVDFKVFSEPATDPQSLLVAMRVPNGNTLSRKQIDGYVEYVRGFDAKGLVYIKVNDLNSSIEGLQSSVLKFLSEEVVSALLKDVEAKTGDIIFICGDKSSVVNDAMGALRLKLGKDLELIEDKWSVLWVTDFPLFHLVDGKLESSHHPFTAPKPDDIDKLDTAPETCVSRAYDFVINGNELASGSIRISDPKIQTKILGLLGIGEQEAHDKFGFLLEAMKYGCPPHGGIAFGFDRIAMLMTDSSSLREVIAFPKTASAHCPLTGAPSKVSDEQLKELNIYLARS